MDALNRVRRGEGVFWTLLLDFSEQGGGFCFPFPHLLLICSRRGGGSNTRFTGASVLSREIPPYFSKHLHLVCFCLSFILYKFWELTLGRCRGFRNFSFFLYFFCFVSGLSAFLGKEKGGGCIRQTRQDRQILFILGF